MALVINQETFDKVVSENMTDFEMEEDEAVKDAIIQFEAQGINLINIIKQPRITFGNNVKLHHAQCVVENLKNSLQSIESTAASEDIIEKCNSLKIVCDRSLPERVLAGKSGALPILNQLLKTYALEQGSNKEVKISVLEAIKSLTYQYPDLFDDDLLTNCFQICEDVKQDLPSLILVLVILRQCCTMHEGNREHIFKRNIFRILRSVITKKNDEENLPVIKESCLLLSALTLDDDPRVLVGQANERIRILTSDEKVLEFLLQLSTKYQQQNDILSIIFDTLSHLLGRDEYCLEVNNLGCVQQVLKLLSNYIKDQTLLRSVLLLIKTLAGSDPVKKEFMSNGGGPILLEVVNENIKSASTCEIACLSIGALALRHPTYAQIFIDSSASEVLTRVLQVHSNSVSVQRAVSVAIRNLVSRSPEFIAAFVEMGVEELLNDAMRKHPTIGEDLKAALRDLHCQVELKESWKGTGFEIPRDD